MSHRHFQLFSALLLVGCGGGVEAQKHDIACLGLGSVSSSSDGSDCCSGANTVSGSGVQPGVGASNLCCTPTGSNPSDPSGSDCCGQGGVSADTNVEQFPLGTCCPTPSHQEGLICDPACSSDQQCQSWFGPSGPYALPSCAPQAGPNGNGAYQLTTAPFTCTADDAQPYDGCTGITETCGTGYDCWRRNGIQICAVSCNQDSDCLNPGVACCASGSCANDIEFLLRRRLLSPLRLVVATGA